MPGLTSLLGIKKVSLLVFDPTKPNVLVDELIVDASVEEAHELPIMVTSHPVSRGIALTDNVRAEPEPFRIVALFTDIGSRIDESVAKVVTRFSSKAIYKKLKDYARKGFVFTINTSLEKLERMVIKRISTPRTSRMADAVEVTIEFIEIRTASAKRARLVDEPAAAKKPVEKKHGTNVKQGTQTVQEAKPQSVDNSSFFRKKLDANIQNTPNLYKGLAP